MWNLREITFNGIKDDQIALLSDEYDHNLKMGGINRENGVKT